MQARIQDFLKGGGGVIAPVGERLAYYLNTQHFQLQGGVITPTTPHPLYPPLVWLINASLVYLDQLYFWT